MLSRLDKVLRRLSRPYGILDSFVRADMVRRRRQADGTRYSRRKANSTRYSRRQADSLHYSAEGSGNRETRPRIPGQNNPRLPDPYDKNRKLKNL